MNNNFGNFGSNDEINKQDYQVNQQQNQMQSLYQNADVQFTPNLNGLQNQFLPSGFQHNAQYSIQPILQHDRTGAQPQVQQLVANGFQPIPPIVAMNQQPIYNSDVHMQANFHSHHYQPFQPYPSYHPYPQYQSFPQISQYQEFQVSNAPTMNLDGQQYESLAPVSINQTSSQPTIQMNSNSQSNHNVNQNQFQDHISGNLSIPAFTKSTFESLLSDDSSKREMIINNLIISSDFFINKAHDMVLMTNTKSGLLNYYKLIKSSIQSLLILIKSYNHILNPQLECIVCFKLAKIYFYETENLNRAEDYINKSIAIATRNNLIKIKFNSEFLASQILNKTNSKISLNYLNDKISFFKNIGFKKFSNLLIFLKINNLMVIDYNQGLAVLQSLSTDLDIDNHTRQLCLLYQINLHLYRGSPFQALTLTNEVDVLQQQSQAQPVQLIGMNLLGKYLIFLQINDIEKCKELMKTLNKFILKQQEFKWNEWNTTGTFQIKIPLELNEFHTSNLPFQVNWINSDEFVIMFYIISGITLLYDSNKKSSKFFSKCLDIIENQLKELRNPAKKRNFPLIDLNNRVIKLNYLKILINYYQTLNNFLSHKFDISPLSEFTLKYDNDSFNVEELYYYKSLIPKIFFIYGQYYQSKGELSKSKYYYSEAIELTSDKNQANRAESMKNSVLTLSIGLGGEYFAPKNKFNEVYVYSTLHLLILYESEIYENLKLNNNENELLNLSKKRNELHETFKKFFENTNLDNNSIFKNNFTVSNNLLLITKSLLSIVYQSLTNIEIKNILSLVYSKVDTLISVSPFLSQLTYYLLIVNSNNLTEKSQFFKKAGELFNKFNGNDKMLNYLIMSQSESFYRNSGQLELADVEMLKKEKIYNEIKSKFELS